MFEALPIMRSCFLRSSKTFQNGGHSWAHGSIGHRKMMETLETKGGQQRQCVFGNLATADSLGQSRRGNCTTRSLLIRNWLLSFSGKSCFLWGLPLRKGFLWQGPDCKWGERFLMSPTCTLETKSGQLRPQRHCLVEILATADSLGQSRNGNCTLRASLTQGTGCFQFLGYPDSLGRLPSRVPLTRPWLIANWKVRF